MHQLFLHGLKQISTEIITTVFSYNHPPRTSVLFSQHNNKHGVPNKLYIPADQPQIADQFQQSQCQVYEREADSALNYVHRTTEVSELWCTVVRQI